MSGKQAPLDEVEAAFDQLARAILSRAKARGVAIGENRPGERHDDRAVREARVAPYAVGASTLAREVVERFSKGLNQAIDRVVSAAVEEEGIVLPNGGGYRYALGVYDGDTAQHTVVYHVGVAGLERVIWHAIGNEPETPPIVKALLP